MKKQYYVWHGDFGNVYNLYWAETPEQIKLAEKNGYSRITRRQAENCAPRKTTAVSLTAISPATPTTSSSPSIATSTNATC